MLSHNFQLSILQFSINGMKPQGKSWTPVPPQRGGVFTIATARSDAVNVITHSRAPLSSQIKSYPQIELDKMFAKNIQFDTNMPSND